MSERDYAIVTNERDFAHLMHTDIATMWSQRQQGEFTGLHGVPIRWISVTKPHHTRAIVLLTGRNETFWKYQEVIYELFEQGFDVYAHDHRGQGESGRLTHDPEVGYVAEFNDYVKDVHIFMQKVLAPKEYQQTFMLAHSMGGTIGALYLAQHSHMFTGAVLNAPMFGIRMNWLEQRLVKPLAKLVDTIQRQPSYFLGKNSYKNKPFKQNDQTQSQLRYEWFKHIYVMQPHLKIGGASAHWVWKALDASNECLRQASEIKTPVLVFQAGLDSIVDNKAQRQFCEKNPLCQLSKMEKGFHELLMEKDATRHRVFAKMLNFFEAC